MKEIFAERIKALREGMHLSQAKIARLSGVNQSNINRYEKMALFPPHEVLLWYADYFDVSMDYLYGRTEHPQGRNYNYVPKKLSDNSEMKQFVEMCFDPKSPMNEKLKEKLMEILEEGAEK